MLLRGMRELLQCGEGLFVGEIQKARVGLNDLKVEGHNTVEQRVIRRKPRSMLRLRVQALSDGCGRLRHASSSLEYPFYFFKHTRFARTSQMLLLISLVCHTRG
jgi:hypothetical protein